MEIRDTDEEKLVLTKDDLKLLYDAYTHMMFIPKAGVSMETYDIMQRLWTAISIIASPKDFDEVKEEFKKKHEVKELIRK